MNTPHKKQVLTQFKSTLISFVDELIGQFPDDSDLVIIRIFLKDQIPIIDIMNDFIIKSIKYKTMISNRDDEMFSTNNDFLNFGGKEGLTSLKKSWVSGEIDNDDKNIIWEWFDSFVFLCEKYNKNE